MKKDIESVLRSVTQELGVPYPERTLIETPKNSQFGDLTTNIAMLLAKECKKNPRAIAEEIVPHLAKMAYIEEVSVAGAGFINIRFNISYWHTLFASCEKAPLYTPKPSSEKVLIEYVSANPTGPLHVGHARGAAYGDSLYRVYKYAGYDVTTEYYINDAGNQMRTLGYSIYLRALELSGTPVTFPEDCYKGEYIKDIAQYVLTAYPTLPTMDIDAAQQICQQYGIEKLLTSIRQDLQDFAVQHEHWFSEKSLFVDGTVSKTLALLEEQGLLYTKDGARWFTTSRFGDNKDRVLQKQDGTYTYFASDIAYHANKLARGYTKLITIVGADHHGYIPRLKAALQALGAKDDTLIAILMQMVSLLKDGKPLSMSTRAGTFETLHDLLAEVGKDPARFLFLLRKNDSGVDFDLTLVTQKNMDNPVFYVQYAHARIQSLLNKFADLCPHTVLENMGCPTLLQEQEELALLQYINAFSDVIESVLAHNAPYLIAQYVTDVATTFHRYYARYQLCSPDDLERTAIRLRLCKKVQSLIRTCLELLGVSAPYTM